MISQPINCDANTECLYLSRSWRQLHHRESVCETCRFPAQLSKKIRDLHPKYISHQIIVEQAGLQPTCFRLLPLKILFQLRFSHFTYWCKQPISKKPFLYMKRIP
jgi:hypothetical protein